MELLPAPTPNSEPVAMAALGSIYLVICIIIN